MKQCRSSTYSIYCIQLFHNTSNSRQDANLCSLKVIVVDVVVIVVSVENLLALI